MPVDWNSGNFNGDLEAAFIRDPKIYALLSETSVPTLDDATTIANSEGMMLRMHLRNAGWDLDTLDFESGSDTEGLMAHVEAEVMVTAVIFSFAQVAQGTMKAAADRRLAVIGNGVPGSESWRASKLGVLCSTARSKLQAGGVSAGAPAAKTPTATWTDPDRIPSPAETAPRLRGFYSLSRPTDEVF